MLGRFLILLLIVPAIELVVLIWLGTQIGFGWVFGLIVGTALLGGWLARREGLGSLRRFQMGLTQGEAPGTELTDGLIILFSGFLLIAPGILTDMIGLLGLLPPTRRAFRRFLTRRLQRSMVGGTVTMFSHGFGRGGQARPEPPRNDDVIDVEFEEIERLPDGRTE